MVLSGWQIWAFVVYLILWVLWLLPFILRRQGGGAKAETKATRARWGIVLEAIAFGLAWYPDEIRSGPSVARAVCAIALEVLGIITGTSAVAALGKQWRVEAALNRDHVLVKTGPYRLVRHPIYASMLCMFLAVVLMVSSWWKGAIALILFVAGTEIRVRTEDKLLASRFGPSFESYRERVRAYLPGLR